MKGMIIAVIAVNCMFFSCEKNGHGPQIRGKLVYRSCASAVVQVLDASYIHLGQASWQMSPSSPVFNNVFKVGNQCSFSNQQINVGQEFYFKLSNTTDGGCAVCALWDNPPTVSQKIVVQ